MKMPTAQSSSTSSSSQNNTKNSKKNVDNKIAKAAAKVAAERGSSGGSQENTRATTPDQQGQQQQQQQQQAPQVTGGVKTPQEQPEFIKQSLIVIEKKVRNLEKRRTKLEEYRDIQAKGTPLNDDQLAAISRYDEVCRTLELSRELEKQFIGLANDAMKQQKKQLKKEQMEREEAVREKLKESQKILALLNSFGDETVRNDFLNELNGASKVSDLELNALDEFNKIVQPANEISSRLEVISNESAEHIYNLIEAKNKQIGQLSAQVVGAAFTYADLKKLFDRIFTSAYWQQRELNLASSSTAAAETPVEAATTSEQQADTQQQIDTHLSEQIGQLNMNVEQQGQQQNDVHHHSNIPLEQVYHQQNTSEDYVLVSAQSDMSGGDAGQNKASRTFFSTLNPQDRNINEFLNRESNEEGINFLQDSEIQSNQPQQQQHQVHEQQHQVEHHHQQQQAPHQHQQHLDNQHPQGGQGFQTYQEFGQNEHYKDSRGPRRDYNGPRNQHQNNNGGNANYPPQQQRPRYQDGGPRRGGGQNGGGIPNQQQPRNNVDRNGGGGGGYRGGNRGGMGGGQRTGGGEYRGGNYSGGPRQGGAGGQQQQRYPPRQQQPADQN